MQSLKTFLGNKSANVAKQLLLTAIVFLFLFTKKESLAQSHKLQVRFVDSSNIFEKPTLEIPVKEISEKELHIYCRALIKNLQQQGFLVASIDTISILENHWSIFLFIGKKYQWAKLSFSSIPQHILKQAGIRQEQFELKKISPIDIATLSEKILIAAENNGHPFAQVYLRVDSVIHENEVSTSFIIKEGLFTKLDTVEVHGDVSISKNYLLQFLSLKEKGVFNQESIASISERLKRNSFLNEKKPSNVVFEKAQTSLHLYLEEKKSNKLNAIIGLLPNTSSTGKMQLTMDAQLSLKNSLKRGEEIDFFYQNLQYQSPKLQLDFAYPFFFHSPIGFDVHFELFKKDTAWQKTFFQSGLRYQFHGNDFVRLFVQQQANRLITVDTNWVLANKKLPANIDVTAFGFGFTVNVNRTDRLFNPNTGWEFNLSYAQLFSTIKRNAAIEGLTSNGFDFNSLYDSSQLNRNQIILKESTAYYFQFFRKLVLKTSLSSGFIKSNNLFQNELFQIGGFQLLRGFNEQSIFAKTYCVSSFEFRIPFDENANVYFFNDNGYVSSTPSLNAYEGWYHGFGVGTLLELKNGLFNLAFSVGATPQTSIQFREAKIHFGYLTLF